MRQSDFSEISLQTLCIDVIVETFDQYILDFKKTKNVAEKRKFEFLLRVYSYKITCQLHKSGELNKYHLDFLINKYIKVLETDWFRGLSWSSIFEKFKEVGPTLQEVRFHKRTFRSLVRLPWMKIVPFLSNVEKLLFDHNCTNEILECIGKYCHNVVDIYIASSRYVNDQGIINLCISKNSETPCPKLKRIVILGTAVQGQGVAHLLQSVPCLEEINYQGLPQILYKMHGNDLSSLDKVKPYNINSLNLSHLTHSSVYSNCLKVCFAVCPHLKSLTCAIHNTTDFGLFSSLSKLEKLHVGCDSLNVINIDDLLKLVGEKLISLTVTGCTLSASGLAEHCPNLKYFQLVDANFLYDQGDSIPMFPCLETFIFEHTKGDAETFKAMCSVLISSPVLERMTYRNCVLSSPELRLNILKCCMQKLLREIYFTGSRVPVSFVKDILLNCHSLSCVDVKDCILEGGAGSELLELSKLLPNKPRVLYSNDYDYDCYDSFSCCDLDFNDPDSD